MKCAELGGALIYRYGLVCSTSGAQESLCPASHARSGNFISVSMKRIKWIFLFLMVLGTALYWISLNDIERTITPWGLRKSLLYYTGVMSFAAMTVGVILAMRLRMVERWLGGLDKHYRLHKWLGISAALFALGHWLTKKYKWLIELGVYDRKDFATPSGTVGFFQHDNFFEPLEDLAQDFGEWALYALLVLAVLALWKRFPYRYFFKTHRLLALIYLILAFHTLILFGAINWLTPIGVSQLIATKRIKV